MVAVQATYLTLPNPPPPSLISSLLFEPHSLSLALIHSDSSLSLYPSFSLSPLPPSPPTPPTLIPSPSSSSTFLLLRHSLNPNPTVLFVVAAPHRAGAQVLLRFFVLRDTRRFTPAQVVCAQKGLHFDRNLGVLVDSAHGVSIRLSGSVNFLTMYSVSSSKIWVFALKMVGSAGEDGGGCGDDGLVVKLMRCAVIDCCVPVWSISMSFGFLMLGEDNGVRVFNLRSLAKGRDKKVKPLNLDGKVEGRIQQLPNGVTGFPGTDDMLGTSTGLSGGGGVEAGSKITCHGYVDGRIERHHVNVKRSSVKLRQDSGDGDSLFVAFKRNEVEGLRSTTAPLLSVKAISIQALSPKKFLILDSSGDIHLMHVSNLLTGSNLTCHIRQLPHVMKVQRLAVLPDTSSRMQTVWVADGRYSLHTIVVSDADDTPTDENHRNKNEEKPVDVSVIQAIFASEKIQDVVSMTANAILVLGQGSLFAYAIS